MGFLDKILNKVGTALATKCGCVASGKYESCSIALGNPTTAKVSVTSSYSQLVFIKGNEEVGRHDIQELLSAEYLETITFPATGSKGYRCKITFLDGEVIEVDLFPSKITILYNSLKNIMFKDTLDFFEKEIKNIS